MRPEWMAATLAVRSAGRRSRAKETAMCRWMAWFGQPVMIEEVLFKTPHGIVDQSLHSRMGAETTNGDGFGLGWYGAGEGPGVYHSGEPAWGDADPRGLAGRTKVPLLFMDGGRALRSPRRPTD